MRTITCSSVLLSLWSALAAPAAAQAPAEVLAEAFARLDRNGDRRIERTEFPGSDAQFRSLGPGDDSSVTAEEFARSALARRILAARARDASRPRPRDDADARVALRVDAALRLDSNRDGRVVPGEWNGDGPTFAELDLDDDGDIDRADRAEARRRAPRQAAPAEFPEFKSDLRDPERLIEKLDRDRSGTLTENEVRGHRIAAAFGWSDQDRDGSLSAAEVQRLAREVRVRVRARNRGDARPSAYPVPFASWDRNGDGRIETVEWRGPKYLFPRIDQDRDAALTRAEVERYVRAIEGDTFVERFDLNGDERVTLEEFGGPVATFRRADRNGDGAVSRADR